MPIQFEVQAALFLLLSIMIALVGVFGITSCIFVCRLVSYRAESAISSCLFTPQCRFLLLACENKKGIVQLCMYQAATQATLPDHQHLENHYLGQAEREEGDTYANTKAFNLKGSKPKK